MYNCKPLLQQQQPSFWEIPASNRRPSPLVLEMLKLAAGINRKTNGPRLHSKPEQVL
jgi:hypothetical protein